MDILLLYFGHQCQVATEFLAQIHLMKDVQEQEHSIVPHTNYVEKVYVAVLGTDDIKTFRKLGPKQDAPNDETEVENRNHERSRSCAFSSTRKYRECYKCHD